MKHEVAFSFKARYFTRGDRNTAREIWFVLHGYGQLAEFFIRKFEALTDHNIYVVAPEGLSRFYLADMDRRLVTGNMRVGATWMTREERMTDIANYISLLNTIYEQEALNGVPVTVLGFSQGAATASRWITQKSVNFRRLILWGGVFPPDLDLTPARAILAEKEVVLVSGNNDPFMKEERYKEMTDLCGKIGIQPRTISYDGGHDIDTETLRALVNE